MPHPINKRRRFLQQSLLATGGIMVLPNLISCESDDAVSEPVVTLEPGNFYEGVASFDPASSEIILWTRYTPPSEASVTLGWQISEDGSFGNPVRSGEVTTGADRDFTVAIEVRDLTPATVYYYRFYNEEEAVVSPVGETRTLPSGSDQATQLTIAACSCANFIAGYFNVYEAIANSDADVVLHLGDYIYEYGNPASVSAGLDREHEPDSELITLGDYRTRYRQYRRDEQLMELHRKKPFITVWDDHEIADNAWMSGAGNHQPDEGAYTQRKQDAIRAYSEYLPVRTNDPGLLYRSIDLGGTAKLLMLDTRHAGRDQQLSLQAFVNTEGTVDADALNQACNAPDRTILGSTQRSWLQSRLTVESGKWLIIGQQVLMGRMLLPAELLPLVEQGLAEQAATGTVSEETRSTITTVITELLQIKLRQTNNDPSLTAEELDRVNTVIPYNLDAWDGYGADREWLLEMVDAPFVVLSGDSHNAWFNDLYNVNRDLKGYEVAAPSVSSPGVERILPEGGVAQLQFEQALGLLLDDLRYVNAGNKGFVTLRCSAGSITASWHFVDTVASTSYSLSTGNTETFTL